MGYHVRRAAQVRIEALAQIGEQADFDVLGIAHDVIEPVDEQIGLGEGPGRNISGRYADASPELVDRHD